MAPILRIANWDRDYEWTTTLARPFEPMKWIKVPNKQGSGYRNLVTHRRGPSHYGAWLAIIQIASKCIPRGVLVNANGKALTSAVLAEKSLLPAKLFDEVLPRLLDADDVGWLEEVTPAELAETLEVLRARTRNTRGAPSADKKERTRTPPNRTLPNRTLPNKKKDGPSASAKASQTGGEVRKPIRPIDDAFLEELQADEAYRHLNVRVCYRQMFRWCENKKKVPSRRRLIAWLNREEKPMEVGRGSEGPNDGARANIDKRSDRLRNRNYEELARRSLDYGSGESDEKD